MASLKFCPQSLEVNVLKQSEKDKNARITHLMNQLKDNEIQSTNRINEELHKKSKQSEIELSKLKEENTELTNDTKKILVKDNNEKQLVEELTEKNNTLVKESNKLKIKNKDLEGELERKNEDLEREIWQLKSGKSLADEMSEVNTNEEIDKLKQQFKAKEGMLQEELKSVKDAPKQLQDILQQEKDQAAISTQTEVEYESKGIQASDHETTAPKTQDQGTNAGVNASSLTGQKEAKEEEDQINRPENIMDWPVPIPNDKPEEQQTPLKPTKVNTELSDPKSTPAEIPKKSTPSKG